MKKSLAEQRALIVATRNEKAARMNEIVEKASAEGRSMDAAEAEEFDGLKMDVKSLDTDAQRIDDLEAIQVQKAAPVAGASTQAAGAARVGVQVKNTQKLEPGIAFARAAKCQAIGFLERRDATEVAKSLYGDRPEIVSAVNRLVTKAAVAAATTTDATWAKPLVGDSTAVFADFVEFLRPRTILGRFGQNGVPALRQVPFRTPLVGQTSGGDGYWTGEGQAKPLTKFDFERRTLEPLKVANIAVATMELVRDSSPAADVVIRDSLADAIRARLDTDFINPAKAAVAGVSPASILNGVTGIASTGSTADNVRTDIKNLFNAFIAANNAPETGVWIMRSTTALALSLMVNPLGQSEFPGIGMNGGTFMGLPVIVSQYVPGSSAGAVVALVNAQDIYFADDGDIDVDMSTEASLQMDNAPDNPSTATTVLVSLWQRNMVGFRAERSLNWMRRRASAVAYLTGVNWA